MPKRVNLELELPDELLGTLREQDLAVKAKEALVMELLREHQISQGKAANLLGMNRDDLFSLMAKYQIPFIDLTEAELDEELNKQLPRQ
jgi:predicted HTH domain antitoxin